MTTEWKLFAIILFLGLLLCGCTTTPATIPPTSGTTPATIPPTSAVAQPVSFMIFGDPQEKAAYEQLVAAFSQQNPDVAVTLIHIPGQSDYQQRLGIDFAAGMPADVILVNYRRYAQYAAHGSLEPLGPYLARSTLIKQDDFFQQAITPFVWQNQLMCIPQNLSSLVVYYNRDLFATAGLSVPTTSWTWADFLAAAQKLTRDTNGDGTIDQYGLGTEAALIRAAPFVWQHGGELVDNLQNPTRLTLDTPATSAALQWFVDLQVRHHVVPDATAEAAESSEQRFLNGRLGMFLNSRRGVPTYRTITAFDWDVAALPRDQQAASILHADGFCLPAASKHKQAAWRLIEFANSPAGQQILATSGRTVPSLRAVAESASFLDPSQKPANSRVFLDVAPTIRAVPIMPAWIELEDLITEELERAFYGQVPLQTAIDSAMERSKSVLGRR